MARSRIQVSSIVSDLGGKVFPSLAAILFATFPAVAEGPERSEVYIETDCRYVMSDDPQAALVSEPIGKTWFPRGDIFRPLLADMKQPRLYLTQRRVRFEGASLPTGGQDSTISAGLVGIGKDYGIWRRSQQNRCNGMQVNLMGAIFSQFNLDTDSDDLINSDFLIGPELTLRRGAMSARVRIYHQSSHLGDEFILNNPGVDRVNLSFEVFDGLLSFEGDWWRLYIGGGYLAGTKPKLDPGLAQWGIELRGLRWRGENIRFATVFGADFQSLEARDWDVTSSLVGGIESSNPSGTHRFRVLLAYLKGTVPFGQFFNTEKVKNYGIMLQFDF